MVSLVSRTNQSLLLVCSIPVHYEEIKYWFSYHCFGKWCVVAKQLIYKLRLTKVISTLRKPKVLPSSIISYTECWQTLFSLNSASLPLQLYGTQSKKAVSDKPELFVSEYFCKVVQRTYLNPIITLPLCCCKLKINIKYYI